jgi:prepilin-type N-terminal cleavage/methylation domain-containing protein
VEKLMLHGLWRSERGFTLLELMTTITILMIVLAIASSTWFGVVESRRVDSATNQVAADLRLAHSAATNRLGTARLIFRNNGEQVSCNGVWASYCLTRPGADGTTQFTRRYLPPDDSPPADRVKLTSPNLLEDPSGGILPPGAISGATSTIEFKSDGSASTLGALGTVSGVPNDCPAGTPTGVARLRVVSADGNPSHCITFNAATSRIEID